MKDQGWLNYGDWLGTGRVASSQREFRPFVEARRFARSLKLKSLTEWLAFCKDSKDKLPSDIPIAPNLVYADKGWKGFGDWLGTGNIATFQRQFRPFPEARSFVQGLKLRNLAEWRLYCNGDLRGKGKLPLDIPKQPNNTYADQGWLGYGDWLGTGNIASSKRQFKSFAEAREFARSLKLESREQWEALCKGALPIDIPKTAHLAENNPSAILGAACRVWRGSASNQGAGPLCSAQGVVVCQS